MLIVHCRVVENGELFFVFSQYPTVRIWVDLEIRVPL